MFCASTAAESRAKIWYQLDAFKPSSGLSCCPFEGGGYVVFYLLLIVTLIVGFCNLSMYCAFLYAYSNVTINLMGKRELVALLSLSS